MKIQRWKLTSPDFPDIAPVLIVASDKATAWRKFTTQRFGELKPNRADWRIELWFSGECKCRPDGTEPCRACGGA